jgi:RNA polymerase primary sigma factor
MNDHAQPSCTGGSDEEIRWYLQDLALMPALSPRAEQEVIQQIAADPDSAEADAVRTLFIEANLYRVVRFARRYQPFGPEFADLIQKGNLALMKAAQRFDPERSHHFRFFAMRRVRWVVNAPKPRPILPSNKPTHLPRILNSTTIGCLKNRSQRANCCMWRL